METSTVCQFLILTIKASLNRFYLNNGLVLKSITELKKELKNMDHLTFYYHVTEHKNDFAAWVYHVFNNKKLAEKIGQVKTKEELIKLL